METNNNNQDLSEDVLISRYWSEFNKEVPEKSSDILEDFSKFLKKKYDIDLVVDELE